MNKTFNLPNRIKSVVLLQVLVAFILINIQTQSIQAQLTYDKPVILNDNQITEMKRGKDELQKLLDRVQNDCRKYIDKKSPSKNYKSLTKEMKICRTSYLLVANEIGKIIDENRKVLNEMSTEYEQQRSIEVLFNYLGRIYRGVDFNPTGRDLSGDSTVVKDTLESFLRIYNLVAKNGTSTMTIKIATNVKDPIIFVKLTYGPNSDYKSLDEKNERAVTLDFDSWTVLFQSENNPDRVTLVDPLNKQFSTVLEFMTEKGQINQSEKTNNLTAFFDKPIIINKEQFKVFQNAESNLAEEVNLIKDACEGQGNCLSALETAGPKFLKKIDFVEKEYMSTATGDNLKAGATYFFGLRQSYNNALRNDDQNYRLIEQTLNNNLDGYRRILKTGEITIDVEINSVPIGAEIWIKPEYESNFEKYRGDTKQTITLSDITTTIEVRKEGYESAQDIFNPTQPGSNSFLFNLKPKPQPQKTVSTTTNLRQRKQPLPIQKPPNKKRIQKPLNKKRGNR